MGVLNQNPHTRSAADADVGQDTSEDQQQQQEVCVQDTIREEKAGSLGAVYGDASPIGYQELASNATGCISQPSGAEYIWQQMPMWVKCTPAGVPYYPLHCLKDQPIDPSCAGYMPMSALGTSGVGGLTQKGMDGSQMQGITEAEKKAMDGSQMQGIVVFIGTSPWDLQCGHTDEHIYPCPTCTIKPYVQGWRPPANWELGPKKNPHLEEAVIATLSLPPFS